jgi:hypothetical protein
LQIGILLNYSFYRFESFKDKKNNQIYGCFHFAWHRPTLAGGNPQLPSALRSLTSVFGMGTGVTFSLSPPDYLIKGEIFACAKIFIPSKLDNG